MDWTAYSLGPFSLTGIASGAERIDKNLLVAILNVQFHGEAVPETLSREKHSPKLPGATVSEWGVAASGTASSQGTDESSQH